MSFNRIRKI